MIEFAELAAVCA